jgi:regulator of RNase E activity RraA|tara:strand:- start:1732 stop:2418 length:687 start_codon:yes stop_codon:yes gene_type:complete
LTNVTPEQLEALRDIPTPAIANAIETFNFKPRNQGFMGPEINSIFPDMGGMIGYAVTGHIRANAQPSDRMSVKRVDWIDEILKIPAPRVIVLEDLDYPNPIGSFWGEVQGNVHTKLGCVGTVTNGGVRDLDEMEEMGFNAFAAAILVSHAYIHLTDAGQPVNVGGLEVSSGDIILGDKHGVISIPPELAADLPAAVKAVEDREQEIIGLCKSPDFSIEKLKAALGART